MKDIRSAFFILLFIAVSLVVFLSGEVRSVIFQYVKIDSIGHFIGFFSLTWLLSTMLKLPLLNLTLTLVVYSALTEVGQHYLGFRNGEFRDVIADTLGILSFMLIKWIMVVYGKTQTI